MPKPDWERFERAVAVATGGKPTPGSGNKSIKGDVRTSSGIFECKQTSKDTISISKLWLTKLQIQFRKEKLDTCCLVIGFNQTGYPYFLEKELDAPLPVFRDWKSLQVKEDSLPEILLTETAVWRLGKWEELYRIE